MSAKETIKRIVDSFNSKPQLKDKTREMGEGLMLGASLADDANELSKDVQAQVDQLVIEGDSSVEAAQARVDGNGKSYTTLKKRLDEKEQEVTAQFAQTELKKADVTYVDQTVSRMSGGAIKGTYTTLVALKTAYPNGAVGPFLIEEDSNRYIWDVNKLNWISIGPYEPAEIGAGDVGTEQLHIESVIPETTSFFDIILGKNKFNKQKLTEGYYLDYVSGNKMSNVGFGYSELEIIKPDTLYTVTHSGVQTSFYDSKRQYIGGHLSSLDNRSFTTPENAVYYSSSINLNIKDVFMLVEGSEIGAYENYIRKEFLKPTHLPAVSQGGGSGRTLYVSKQVPSRYLTIGEAIVAANEGDSVFVYSGTYIETLDFRSKTIYLIGENKDTTILISTSNSYDLPPIEASRGGIYNMTVWAKRDTGATNPSDGRMPYAIHLDYSFSDGGTYAIENCVVKSDWNAALGVGFKKGFTLKLKNSEFSSTADTTNGAFFFHDADAEIHMGSAKLIVDTCNFKAPNIVLMPSSFGDARNRLDMTWYRNMIYSELDGKTNGAVGVGRAVTGSGWRTYNNFFLTPDSFGNNHALFNVT